MYGKQKLAVYLKKSVSVVILSVKKFEKLNRAFGLSKSDKLNDILYFREANFSDGKNL